MSVTHLETLLANNLRKREIVKDPVRVATIVHWSVKAGRPLDDVLRELRRNQPDLFCRSAQI